MESLVHLYYGEGKGKTTAAMGLALRCAGTGGKVLIFQFLKGESGERQSLATLPEVTLWKNYPNVKFTFRMTPEEKEAATQWYTEQFRKLWQTLSEESFQMVVLDEILGAIHAGLFPESLLLSFLQQRPKETELVLTGRNPSDALLQYADYATEMVKQKHPFDQGVPARRGIEY